MRGTQFVVMIGRRLDLETERRFVPIRCVRACIDRMWNGRVEDRVDSSQLELIADVWSLQDVRGRQKDGIHASIAFSDPFF